MQVTSYICEQKMYLLYTLKSNGPLTGMNTSTVERANVCCLEMKIITHQVKMRTSKV